VFLCCVPLYFGLTHGGTATAADYVGFVASLVAVGLETVADEQLRMFVASAAKGSNCDVGLWKYSRHPNYCGEMLFWWSCYFYALGAAHEKYWWMFVGPLSVMITVITASIPLMEKRQLARRPGYAAYQAKTAMLVPLPRKFCC
jgi:steroid 5-alpha reductase family enzyme